jgi:hypothetical protein
MLIVGLFGAIGYLIAKALDGDLDLSMLRGRAERAMTDSAPADVRPRGSTSPAPVESQRPACRGGSQRVRHDRHPR